MKISSCVVALVTDGNCVALTHRTIPPFQNSWVLPGGKIEFGESIHEALKREVMEEVGIEVEVGELIGVFEHPAKNETDKHFVVLGYECKPVTKELKPNGDECDIGLWARLSDLKYYNTPEGTTHLLNLLKERKENVL